MIDIRIRCEHGKIVNSFIKKDLVLEEASAVLLRLKQVEHEIINLEFEPEFELKKKIKRSNTGGAMTRGLNKRNF